MKIKFEKVLLFNITGEKLAGIAVILTSMGIRFSCIGASEHSLPITDLLEITDIGGSDSNSFDDEMLLMFGLRDSKINSFLNRLKECNIKIDLKAVATESNINWSAFKLYEELKKEHLALNK